MNETKPKWKRLRSWPQADAEAYLNLPCGTGELCRKLFEEHRIRIEILKIDSENREIRIPCSKGYDSGLQQSDPETCETPQIYPVTCGTWAAIVSGGHWTREMMRVLGDDARKYNYGIYTEDDIGNRYDESTVYFPPSRIWDVICLLKPKKRPRGNPNPNMDGIIRVRKPDTKAALQVYNERKQGKAGFPRHVQMRRINLTGNNLFQEKQKTT